MIETENKKKQGKVLLRSTRI